MMRVLQISVLAILLGLAAGPMPVWSQQTRPNQANPNQAAAAPQNRIARQQPAPAPAVPFELTPQEQATLDRVLMAWEEQSSGTKTLSCGFTLWDYDVQGAPAGIHASASRGIVRYANPDKGLFREEEKVFYNGMGTDGKPTYEKHATEFGQHWVCNGREVIEFDHEAKQCKVQELPPNMQGKAIVESPLPFVFNSNAADIKARYWVRLLKAPKESQFMIEAWPKRREDAAQYKLVQIVLEKESFLPAGLALFAPNFNVATTPNKQIYEFTEIKRNGVGQGMQVFLNNFIPQKPPSSWKIFRQKFPVGIAAAAPQAKP